MVGLDDAGWLEEQYWGERRTLQELAVTATAVPGRLERNWIPRRGRGGTREEELADAGCSVTAVIRRLRAEGVEVG